MEDPTINQAGGTQGSNDQHRGRELAGFLRDVLQPRLDALRPYRRRKRFKDEIARFREAPDCDSANIGAGHNDENDDIFYPWRTICWNSMMIE